MRVSPEIEREARQWLDLHISGEMSEASLARFRHWIKRSQVHRTAYREQAALWRDLDWSEALNGDALLALDETASQETDTYPAVAPRRSWVFGLGGAMAACFAITVFFLWRPDTPASKTSEPVPGRLVADINVYETAIGEIETFTLADGSEVTLAGNTTLRVSYSADARDAELNRGDAYFAIAPDATRPFSVRTEGAVARVLGTAFEINNKSDGVEVSVVTGHVEVESADHSSKATLSLGERALIHRRGGLELSGFDPSRAAPWRDRRLVFVKAPLKELVAEVNQFYPPKVYLLSSELHEVEVTTSFRLDQVELAMSGVAMSLGIDLQADDDGTLVLRSRSDEK